MTRVWPVIVMALLVGFVAAGPTAAVETMKHSGTVVSVDEPSGTLVMHEIGPWQLRDGKTVLTTLRITLTPETEFAIVSREAPAVRGTVGPFVERPIAGWALYKGDFVTVDCRHEGTRLIATKVTVTYVPTE
jgi:hypothetical protein